MFSQTNEYALRVVAFLAGNLDRPAKNADIAKATKVPAGYLYKVLQTLDRAGLVRAQRGIHGGFTLARSPAEISLLDVIQAVDPLPRIRHCPLGLKSHGKCLCPVHHRLDQAFALVEEVFRTSTLADLLAETSNSVPLCNSASQHPR
ncbi:MAG: Rrf2 family transcriptional regulator [Phycisphaerales bacterium]|nr:Rrf2 family transcriptional regulator [Phycisphaerales bacterium]